MSTPHPDPPPELKWKRAENKYGHVSWSSIGITTRWHIARMGGEYALGIGEGNGLHIVYFKLLRRAKTCAAWLERG